MRSFVICTLLLSLILPCSGCSSLVSDEAARSSYLKAYQNQPVPLILYYPSHLNVDEQLNVLGMSNVAMPLEHYFDTKKSIRSLIEKFVSDIPSLASSNFLIVDPEQWAGLEEAYDKPVLFFFVDWRLSYRRIPPDLKRYRLQANVISKIIPLSQVLSNKGTIALRTSAWEGRCQFDGMEGKYYSIDEWIEGDARRLIQSLSDMQQLCGHMLAQQFTE